MGYGHTWGDQRVFYRERSTRRVRSLPASWTDVASPDPFLVVAAGRALFRVAELLLLVDLLGQLAERRVKEITP